MMLAALLAAGSLASQNSADPIAQISDVVEIGENNDLKLELVLTEAAIARLREMLK